MYVSSLCLIKYPEGSNDCQRSTSFTNWSVNPSNNYYASETNHSSVQMTPQRRPKIHSVTLQRGQINPFEREKATNHLTQQQVD